MKKISFFIIIVLVVLTTSSCLQMQFSNNSAAISYYNENMSNLTENDSNNVQLIYIESPERNRVLSNEHTQYLNAIWHSDEWQPDVTKTLCLFEFKVNGVVLRYSSEGGVFIDDTNQRHIVVTNEQRDYINTSLIGITVQ